MEYENNKVALVSIIMPTYNQAEYIKAAIDSVFAQSYPIFELIVIDNYSTDATSNVVHSYHDPRIKYLKFDIPLGVNLNKISSVFFKTKDTCLPV